LFEPPCPCFTVRILMPLPAPPCPHSGGSQAAVRASAVPSTAAPLRSHLPVSPLPTTACGDAVDVDCAACAQTSVRETASAGPAHCHPHEAPFGGPVRYGERPGRWSG